MGINSKLQGPTSKIQRNSKRQIPESVDVAPVLELEICGFSGAGMLMLGTFLRVHVD
jgi:hypothetical protein